MPRIGYLKTSAPSGEEESLHTPLPLPPTAIDGLLSSGTPSLTTTCGLFDIPTPETDPIHEILNSDKDPSLTTTTDMSKDVDLEGGATRSMRLESLDPRELETLLGELASGPQPTEAEEAAVPVAPWDAEESPAPQGDHDYCEDWNVLSEFMEMTKPCLAETEREETMSPGLAALANEALQQTDFLETAQDLQPILLGSIRLGGPVEEETAAPACSAGEPLRDVKYWERRRKNNAASAASRRTRKEKRLALEEERRSLQSRRDDLVADVARLEALTKEWKARLLTLIG